MFAEMTQDYSHAPTNLATATQSDRTTVENMSHKITNLTLQLGQANAKLVEAQSSIAALTSELSQTWTRPKHPPGTINKKAWKKTATAGSMVTK